MMEVEGSCGNSASPSLLCSVTWQKMVIFFITTEILKSYSVTVDVVMLLLTLQSQINLVICDGL